MSDSEDDDPSCELKDNTTATSTNEGLIVEELESGKQHGGVACSGNKVCHLLSHVTILTIPFISYELFG